MTVQLLTRVQGKAPVLGIQSPHLQVHLKCDDASGNVLRDYSGRGNHFVSALPAGFSANFWATAGRATFNSGATTDAAILANNRSTQNNVKDPRMFWFGKLNGSYGPSFIFKARYTPLAVKAAYSDLFSLRGRTAAPAVDLTKGFSILGSKSGTAEQYHEQNILVNGSEMTTAWATAVTDEMADGGALDLNIERDLIIVIDRSSTSSTYGDLTVYVNGTAALDAEALASAFAGAFAPTDFVNDYCAAIGCRAARLESGRSLSFSIRDVQIYMGYSDIPAGLIAQLPDMAVNETLTRADWG